MKIIIIQEVIKRLNLQTSLAWLYWESLSTSGLIHRKVPILLRFAVFSMWRAIPKSEVWAGHVINELLFWKQIRYPNCDIDPKLGYGAWWESGCMLRTPIAQRRLDLGSHWQINLPVILIVFSMRLVCLKSLAKRTENTINWWRCIKSTKFTTKTLVRAVDIASMA